MDDTALPGPAVPGPAHPDAVSPGPVSPGPGQSGSLFRRHLAEWRMILVAWRLLVLQTSHPVVAAGTAEHSTYRAHPWRRIEHTMSSGRRLVFADRATLRREVARLDRAHRRIQGVDGHGQAYSAQDPATRVWVLITLYESVVAMRELSGDPLGPAELDVLYGEFSAICAEFRLPGGVLPRTAAEVPAYVDTVVRECLEFNAQARYLLFDMLREAPRPRRLRLLAPLWPLLRLLIAAVLTTLTIADLPPAYRERFGLVAGRPGALLSRVLHHGARRVATRLPDRLRYRTQSDPSAAGPIDVSAPRRFRPGRRDTRRPRLGRFFSEVLDQTGDGFISSHDLRAMAHNVCWQLELDDAGEEAVYAGFDAWWEELRRTMDTDGDGRISKAEFVAAAIAAHDRDPEHPHQQPQPQPGLRAALHAVFRAADTDRSGFIGADEYRVVFGSRLHPAEISHGFRQLDRDGDGRLSEAEFVHGFTEFFTARGDLAAGSQLLGRP
ncbi:oxygenase MpaB family protein [Streptomyces jumonjinensis]|uniref:DUF2236 domain-containing protein n=1 Tax=Streptomyces jumonjinensis TaxID=1945 RepID=A0A646KLN6_STRJU|nr:oxygenase MpaB family protein [Streptomyces jumonjinensis]MQT03000.1 DUF2236 domain-containing protein [Streptomyces jumonjinensis]